MCSQIVSGMTPQKYKLRTNIGRLRLFLRQPPLTLTSRSTVKWYREYHDSSQRAINYGLDTNIVRLRLFSQASFPTPTLSGARCTIK